MYINSGIPFLGKMTAILKFEAILGNMDQIEML